MSRDSHPTPRQVEQRQGSPHCPHLEQAGGAPRPHRRPRITGPWYHSTKAALFVLAVLIAWGFLLPGGTPVGGGMSTLGSLSLFGYALFSVIGGIVFLSNRDMGRALSSCAAVGLLVLCPLFRRGLVAAGLRVLQFRDPWGKRHESAGGRVSDHA